MIIRQITVLGLYHISVLFIILRQTRGFMTGFVHAESMDSKHSYQFSDTITRKVTKPNDTNTGNQTEIPQPQQEYKSLDYLSKLCLDMSFNGGGIVEGTTGKVIILFKSEVFWAIKYKTFLDFIDSPDVAYSVQNEIPITRNNSMESESYWPSLKGPIIQVISTLGLPTNDSFYNNVFIFQRNIIQHGFMSRYRVEEINYNHNKINIWEFKIKHLRDHSTMLWIGFQNFQSSLYQAFIPGTRGIFHHQVFDAPSIYLLNDNNLDNPVQYVPVSQNFINLRIDEKLTPLILTGDNGIISFSSSGKICRDSRCKPVATLVPCEGELNNFINSSAYWLWRGTSLTMRLIIIAICSVMMINFIISFTFLAHQIDRIKQLT